MSCTCTSDIHREDDDDENYRLGSARRITGSGLLVVASAQIAIFLLHPDTWQWFSMVSASGISIFLDTVIGTLLMVSGRVWIGYVGTALLLFFVGHSFHVAAQGKPSCGCIPKVPVPPWVSIAFGVFLLGFLIASFPAAQSSIEGGATLGRGAREPSDNSA